MTASARSSERSGGRRASEDGHVGGYTKGCCEAGRDRRTKDRKGIVLRDPKFGAKHQITLLLALLPTTLDVSVVASTASEGKSNGRRALLHLSLLQERFLCCYGDQK
jgi:hypothetical protein